MKNLINNIFLVALVFLIPLFVEGKSTESKSFIQKIKEKITNEQEKVEEKTEEKVKEKEQVKVEAKDKEKDKDLADRIAELEKLGEVYIVNGTKIFISSGYGDILTLAKINDGISMFLVFEEDKTVPRVEHKLGIRGSATCEVYHDNSPGVLIGELGGGLIPNMMRL